MTSEEYSDSDRCSYEPSRMRALFYPDKVSVTATIRGIFEQLGWEISYNLYGDFAFAVSWGNFQNRWTDPGYQGRAVLDLLIKEGYCILNKGVHNTSKRFVESCHRRAFGYGTTLDPCSWSGLLVEKSVRNYAKDGRVITGPLSPEDVKADKIYQKLINCVDPQGLFWSMKTFIVDGSPTWIHLFYTLPEYRFIGRTYRCRSIRPYDGFSENEIDRVRCFCSSFGLDYGELDILRDLEDGRIYVVDANPQPGGYGNIFSTENSAFPSASSEHRLECLRLRDDARELLIEPFQQMVYRKIQR